VTTVEQNTNFQIRPRFKIESDTLTREIVYEKIKEALNSPDAPCEGRLRLGYVDLFPKKEDKHYWSPHLSMTIEEEHDEDHDLTIIRGLYGPHPAVWTMFVFFYTIIAFLTIVCIVIGFANMSIGNSTTILWAVPFLILAFGSLYLVSFYGQKKGHDQIENLHLFLEKTLNTKL